MNKIKLFSCLFGSASLLLSGLNVLASEEVYPYSKEYMASKFVPEEEIPEMWEIQAKEAGWLPEEEQETEVTLNTDTLPEVTEDLEEEVYDIIFAGDSRVVGMAASGTYHYVGKSGAGYDWLVSDGADWLMNEMALNPYSDIVLCFGVNDVAHISDYISYYKTLMSIYPQRRFWVMSVNPCVDSMASSEGYFVRDDMIVSFNEVLQEAFPDQYLDCYSYLKENGFGTNDGVHYDQGTYLVIEEYTKFVIEMKINGYI